MSLDGETKPRWTGRFFTIWVSQALSLVGSSLAQFALVWWLTQTTGSATVLATATLMSLLPGVVLGPLAGALVDRWNRRLVMIAADGTVALASAWLALLFWTGGIQVWHVYVAALVRAIGGSFHWPAMQASTSLMVPEKQLTRVAGLNQTMYGVLNIISPPLGALLLGLLPLHAIMGIDVGTALLAIAPLLFLTVPQPTRSLPAASRRATVWQDLGEGLRYIWQWPGAVALLGMAAVINLLVNPGFSLLPLLVTRHFNGGALQLGGLESAWGFGVIAGGLILSAWGGFRRRILTTLVGLIGMGLGTLVLGLAPATAFWLAVGSMFFAGLMNPITNGPVMAILQARVEPQMQGRVFTVVGSLSSAMSPLGLAVAGPVADWLGVQVWFLVGGAVCALMGMVGLFVPAILFMEDGVTGRRGDAEMGVRGGAETRRRGDAVQQARSLQ
jgi:DHA3 family macrolide efflux protein-like MFS transporter